MGMHEGYPFTGTSYGMFQIRNLDEWRVVIKILLFYLLIYFYEVVKFGTMLYVLHFLSLILWRIKRNFYMPFFILFIKL